MTTDAEWIEAALRELDVCETVVCNYQPGLEPLRDTTSALAKLIRQLTKGDNCSACFTVAVSVNGHAENCALIALCKAIAGEQP